MSRNFMATMLKRAQSKEGWILRSHMQPEIDEIRNRLEEQRNLASERWEKQFMDLKAHIDQFEKLSGINTGRHAWGGDAKKIGEAVKFIVDGGASGLKEDLLKIEADTEKILQNIKHGLEAIKQTETKT